MDRRTRWHLAQDVAVAVMIAAIGLAEVWVPFESVQGTGSPLVSTVAILVCAVLLAMRRIVPLALVGVPLTWVACFVATAGDTQVLFFGGFLPLALTLYTGARHGSLRTSAAVCGSVFAAVILADFFVPELQGPSEVLFHWGVLLTVFLIGIGMRVSERRAVDAAVRASIAETEAREAALRAVADERARIARELHDILGHSVSVMVVQAGAAAEVVDIDAGAARRALEAIRTTGTDALAEVRRVVELLREADHDSLSPQPGIARIPELIEQARGTGLAVEFRADDTSDLSAGRQLAVYRVIQEALTNVRRHSGAASAMVAIDRTADRVDVTVTDDGGDADPVGAAGHGLVGMRERVTLYGGTLEAGPGPSGWRVHASLPTGAGS
ncbi:sensor histidine kinase [Agromyces binzhouensis]|uniref:histidine kinase n=1 Tax=Agromyces binzhouensis TaxID=1817495 RepID=A0A4Q2JXS4_9MICO|nr:histidine kinase [Agromyces binzhouensis]RXZ51607.1 sensor histidine kinase [Agromyces binzhouensis]